MVGIKEVIAVTENKNTTSRSVQLKISGMTCAACSARIEKGLSKLAGVEKAAVNLASEKAVVTYDPTQINPEAMVQKIHDLGYEVIKDRLGQYMIFCSRTNSYTGLTDVNGDMNEYEEDFFVPLVHGELL